MRAMCSLAAAMVVGGGALGVSIARLVLGLRQGLLRGCSHCSPPWPPAWQDAARALYAAMMAAALARVARPCGS